MAIKEIITVPDPLLKTVSKEVDNIDEEILSILDDMLETMYAAPGIGLAAIQIGIPKRMLVIDISLFYNSTIYTVLSYANIAFYDMLPTYLKHDLNRPRNICRKLVSNEFYELSDNSTLYKLKSFKTATKIIKDSTHPLHTEYEYLPSGRRLRVPRARTNRFKYSFVPRSIHLINNM